MAVMAMKRNLTERARLKAFESIFTKFDHNQNGKSLHYKGRIKW